ncbi:MAG: transposase [Armatimonadota bacterium]|nr:transposase [Armatimonadota bacterium]
MNRWHNYYADNHAHFSTFTCKDWQPLLTETVITCLYDEWRRNSERFSVKVLAYVIMPEHVHVLIWSEKADNVVRFLQRSLGQTTKRLKLGAGGLWKERPRVFPVQYESVISQKMDYIHANPVRRGLVDVPEDWRHFSYGQLMLGEDDPAFRCASLE